MAEPGTRGSGWLITPGVGKCAPLSFEYCSIGKLATVEQRIPRARAIVGIAIAWARVAVDEKLKNPFGLGIRKGINNTSGFHPLDKILDGQYPNYPVWKLKKRLLLSGYIEEKCCNCGFEERRVTDHRVPLVLDFVDSNRKNHKYENLRMLCFNCSFLINGNLTGPRKEYEY